jgi:hypothetical protein
MARADEEVNAVWIPGERVYGEIVSVMAYGAVVKYVKGGLEFNELLSEEDYEYLPIETGGMLDE